MTKYRKRIYEIINTSCSHLNAYDVYEIIKKEMPDVVLATIYNNLNALVDEHMINKISIPGKIDHYDKLVKHDHLICSRCGKLIDFKFEDLTKNLESQAHVSIVGYDLKAFIICDECKNK